MSTCKRMTFREIIACVLLQRILRHCKTPHYAKCHMAILNRDPTPNNENQATTRDNEQSDKKGGCFHRHRKVWRILSDGALDFNPQQRRVSARRNVILSSVWWLTWIDSKSVSAVCLHLIIVHVDCGVICASQDSKHYSIKVRTFLPTTKEKGVYCQLRSSDSPNLQV